jgi:hypothetical protein
MEESFYRPKAEPIWYENYKPIQEYLESFQKPAILESDYQVEELSWVQIIENSTHI